MELKPSYLLNEEGRPISAITSSMTVILSDGRTAEDAITNLETTSGVLPSDGVTDHALLDNLDYDSSGHTGFVSTVDFEALELVSTLPYDDQPINVNLDTIDDAINKHDNDPGAHEDQMNQLNDRIDSILDADIEAWLPNVDENSNITFTLSPTTTPPQPRNIKGERGNDGVVAPTDGFFNIYVDALGNLIMNIAESAERPLRFDEATGNLYAIIN